MSDERASPEAFADRVRLVLSLYADDTEARHMALDDLMLGLLAHLGYSEGVKLIEASERWFA